MTLLLLVAVAVALLVVLIVQVLLLARRPAPEPDLAPLLARTESIERAQERTERGLREEIGRNREEASAATDRLTAATEQKLETVRGVIEERLKALQQENAAKLDETRAALDRLTAANEQKLDAVRGAIEERLKTLQQENTAKLEQIRQTVDDQLHTTLEKRLGESFKLVSDRLDQVHRGLGEMQTLAAGVGDLKKLLSNVRARGTWGEVQLGMILEQILTPEQYGVNVATTGTSERVEFAIKLPGGEPDGCVWLPIDAKFPKEDYERLLDAVERADQAAVEESSRQLEVRIRQCAKDIWQKYVAPPATTDFAVMYLPTEGLYAEVLRRPGLIEILQREYHVTVAGPMTLSAILSSLQMGFRTLAIQKRSSEVWEVLGRVKTDFDNYSDILAKVQKKLQEAVNTVEAGQVRTRVIQRKLKDVQALPAGGSEAPAAEEAEELESEAAAGA
jgi:DNA recombination protein RmuC